MRFGVWVPWWLLIVLFPALVVWWMTVALWRVLWLTGCLVVWLVRAVVSALADLGR